MKIINIKIIDKTVYLLSLLFGMIAWVPMLIAEGLTLILDWTDNKLSEHEDNERKKRG